VIDRKRPSTKSKEEHDTELMHTKNKEEVSEQSVISCLRLKIKP